MGVAATLFGVQHLKGIEQRRSGAAQWLPGPRSIGQKDFPFRTIKSLLLLLLKIIIIIIILAEIGGISFSREKERGGGGVHMMGTILGSLPPWFYWERGPGERLGDRVLAQPTIFFCHNKLNLDLQPQLKNTKFDTCGLDASRFHGVKCTPVWGKNHGRESCITYR